MFLKNPTSASTADSSAELDRLREALARTETVIIGAGAGLSASAGLVYTGERFRENFQDFIDRYHFTDMYSGGFHPFDTPEEYWAYWSRYIYINRYTEPPKPVYAGLLALVRDKDYFVLTTNVDHQFQKAGFDKSRLFYTQGDFGLWQCSAPCHRQTYDNEAAVHQMITCQKEMRIPSALIPRCPVCGRLMSMNLRADNTFAEDEGWHQASARYADFLRGHRSRRVLFLELGTGYNTPGIIKYSFWQMTAQWPDAAYACVNLDEAYAPEEIKKKAICVNQDIGRVLEQL